jgi:hypothetical protein
MVAAASALQPTIGLGTEKWRCWLSSEHVVRFPIAYCACGLLGRRQAQAAFGGRSARLDPGQPPEAWLGIGFRDGSRPPSLGWERRAAWSLPGLSEVRII